jgi:2-polyprenyl-6-methoxyphenol hydroxylase-like FAD-dependent oxidoreductase
VRVEELASLDGYDLVVAADGVNSRLRRAHPGSFGTRVDTGRNRYMWLGTTKVFDSFTFAFVRSGAGWIWCHAYGFDATASTFIVECSAETWAGLGFGELGLEESIARLEELFAAQLDGHRLVAQAQDPERAPWLSFRTVTNERWHHGNLVLAGDAAHTTHFTHRVGHQAGHRGRHRAGRRPRRPRRPAGGPGRLRTGPQGVAAATPAGGAQ